MKFSSPTTREQSWAAPAPLPPGPLGLPVPGTGAPPGSFAAGGVSPTHGCPRGMGACSAQQALRAASHHVHLLCPISCHLPLPAISHRLSFPTSCCCLCLPRTHSPAPLSLPPPSPTPNQGSLLKGQEKSSGAVLAAGADCCLSGRAGGVRGSAPARRAQQRAGRDRCARRRLHGRHQQVGNRCKWHRGTWLPPQGSEVGLDMAPGPWHVPAAILGRIHPVGDLTRPSKRVPPRSVWAGRGDAAPGWPQCPSWGLSPHTVQRARWVLLPCTILGSRCCPVMAMLQGFASGHAERTARGRSAQPGVGRAHPRGHPCPSFCPAERPLPG